MVLGVISPFLYLTSAVNDFDDGLEQIKLTTGGNHLIWMGRWVCYLTDDSSSFL